MLISSNGCGRDRSSPAQELLTDFGPEMGSSSFSFGIESVQLGLEAFAKRSRFVGRKPVRDGVEPHLGETRFGGIAPGYHFRCGYAPERRDQFRPYAGHEIIGRRRRAGLAGSPLPEQIPLQSGTTVRHEEDAISLRQVGLATWSFPPALSRDER